MSTNEILNVRSMNILKEHTYYPPALKIETELENLSDHQACIDRILFRIDVSIGNSSWKVGDFWHLEREAVREKTSARLRTECPIDFEILKRINDRVLEKEGGDIIWRVRICLYFTDQSSQQIEIRGDSSSQKPPWTPRSTWERWFDGWKNLSIPLPYSLMTDLQSILDRADSGLQSLEKEIDRIERMSETLSYLQRVANERDQLEIDKGKLASRIIELEEVSQDFSYLIDIGKMIDVDENWMVSVCALSLIEVMVNKKLDQLGEKREGDFRKRLNRLVEQAKRKEGKEVGNIVTDIFYVARNKILHGGEVPTRDERRKIIDFVRELATKLWE